MSLVLGADYSGWLLLASLHLAALPSAQQQYFRRTQVGT